VLPSVKLDYRTLLATDEVDVIPANRLLAHKFEAAELAVANARPQGSFFGRKFTPQ
jgi:hypothetical protein